MNLKQESMNSQESRKAGKDLELGAISQAVIGAAIAVHQALGPGFIESIYEEALTVEFFERGIPFERQKPVSITYRGKHIGEHRLDFLIAGKLVLELKAIKALEMVHFAVVRSYLKATRCEHGLLLNFSTMPLTIKRVIREQSKESDSILHPTFS